MVDLVFTTGRYASAVFATAMCLSVRLSVTASIVSKRLNLS